MISCQIKNNVGIIGLIATNPKIHGKGVGSKLVKSAEWYFQQSRVKSINVVTQRENSIACGFYENIGFNLDSEDLVFHWWRTN
jgi:dTDP-4-amino-4,6-dideoxy-D-galactose acyltransferase